MRKRKKSKLLPAQKQEMKALSNTAMGGDLSHVLSDIESMLQSARQTIDASLQQSSALVEESRKWLLDNHQHLSTTSMGDPLQQSASQEQALALQEESQVQDDVQQLQASYELNIDQQQQAAQASAEAAEEAMQQAIAAMGDNLLAQQQAYEQRVNAQINPAAVEQEQVAPEDVTTAAQYNNGSA